MLICVGVCLCNTLAVILCLSLTPFASTLPPSLHRHARTHDLYTQTHALRRRAVEELVKDGKDADCLAHNDSHDAAARA